MWKQFSMQYQAALMIRKEPLEKKQSWRTWHTAGPTFCTWRFSMLWRCMGAVMQQRDTQGAFELAWLGEHQRLQGNTGFHHFFLKIGGHLLLAIPLQKPLGKASSRNLFSTVSCMSVRMLWPQKLGIHLHGLCYLGACFGTSSPLQTRWDTVFLWRGTGFAAKIHLIQTVSLYTGE